MNSTQVIREVGVLHWADTTKDISQLLSRCQHERNVLRQSSSAVGGEHFGFAAAEDEVGGTVVDMNPKPRGGGNGKRKDVIYSFQLCLTYFIKCSKVW